MPVNDQHTPREQMVQTIASRCFAAVFLAVLFGITLANILQGFKPFLGVFLNADSCFSIGTISAAEAQFDSSFFRRQDWINLYGGVQRVLGKHETDNFDVIKDQNGYLHMQVEKFTDQTLLSYTENLHYFHTLCQDAGIPFLYVQAPSDYLPVRTQFPLGVNYGAPANENIDAFLQMVRSNGISCIDVRELVKDMPLSEVFYRTDHHWRIPAAFRTAQEIAAVLNLEAESFCTNVAWLDPENYRITAYENSFLGSRGIRTGSLYAGKDTFLVWEPVYETRFSHEYYVDGELQWTREGNFLEVFADAEMLEDPDYNNKYNALMYTSACESRITNHMAGNDLRCLVIADSFGRQLVPFLSQGFHQTAYLDPQEGRFDGSVTDYIAEFLPDVVIVLFNGNSCYVPIPR